MILIPGLWLDASSWDDVVPVLHDAGHDTHPLTLPGTGSPASESADVGIADWVAAVVAQTDALSGDALPADSVLVGHSGGGSEFNSLQNVRVVHLGTGHWPQFTQPLALGRAIVDAIAP